MNASGDEMSNPCFTDFAFQEYLLGRLDAGVRRELEDHLPGCEQCEACVGLIAKEMRLLRLALKVSDRDAGEVEIDDETLSLYLDGSLDAGRREACEEALVSSRGLRARLVAMRSDLAAVLGEVGATEKVAAVPEGRILRIPKRLIVPRGFSDLSVGNSEAAEG